MQIVPAVTTQVIHIGKTILQIRMNFLVKLELIWINYKRLSGQEFCISVPIIHHLDVRQA